MTYRMVTEILCLHPILEVKLKYDTNTVRKTTLKEQYIILIGIVTNFTT